MQELLLLIWGQLQLGFESGAGVIHRIPTPRERPWSSIFQKRQGERRLPGPIVSFGFMLREKYRSDRFIESGGMGRWYSLQVEERREEFFTATVPIRWGSRIDTTSWWLWGGLAASLLLQAKGYPASSGVYKFADYFSRSQLHLQAGMERSITDRASMGVQISWDLTSAWDRVLFQDSRTLARHFSLALYLRYATWSWR